MDDVLELVDDDDEPEDFGPHYLNSHRAASRCFLRKIKGPCAHCDPSARLARAPVALAAVPFFDSSVSSPLAPPTFDFDVTLTPESTSLVAALYLASSIDEYKFDTCSSIHL